MASQAIYCEFLYRKVFEIKLFFIFLHRCTNTGPAHSSIG